MRATAEDGARRTLAAAGWTRYTVLAFSAENLAGETPQPPLTIYTLSGGAATAPLETGQEAGRPSRPHLASLPAAPLPPLPYPLFKTYLYNYCTGKNKPLIKCSN